MRPMPILAMTAVLFIGPGANASEVTRPLTATAFTLHEPDDEENDEEDGDIKRPTRKRDFAELRQARALGGAGAAMFAFGALSIIISIAAISSQGILDSRSNAAGVLVLVGLGLLVSGGIVMAVGFGRAARLKRGRRSHFTLLPAPRPGGASLQLVARW